MSDLNRPSERREIAERIAAFIRDNELANPFGGDVDQSSDKRHYGVLMSIPRLLDGQVRVYSPKFIFIGLAGPLSNHGSQFVYDSEQRALDFLRLYLVEHKIEEAMAIPQRPQRSK